MNKKTLSKLTFLVSIVITTTAIAGGWSGSAKVLEIYPAPGNNGILIKHASMPNPDNCTSPGLYVLDIDNMFFKEIFSLLMSAQARQSNINLQVSGCKGRNNTHPSIFQVIAK